MARTFKQLTYEQRCELKRMLDDGMPVSHIAKTLNMHTSTIYREIERGKVNGNYNPDFSESRYQTNLANKGPEEIFISDRQLAQTVANYILNDNLSPKAIVNQLAKRNGEFEKTPFSYTTIYKAIDEGLIPGVTRETLRPTETKVFNNGTLYIANWVMDELGINDGDILHFDVVDGKLIYSKSK